MCAHILRVLKVSIFVFKHQNTKDMPRVKYTDVINVCPGIGAFISRACHDWKSRRGNERRKMDTCRRIILRLFALVKQTCALAN